MKQLVNIAAVIVLLFGFGCTKRLAPGGIYQGDQLLYEAERMTLDAYKTLDAYVTWEKENRALINNAEVQKSASTVRANAKAWLKTMIAMRNAYVASPTDGNRDALEKSVAVLRVALFETAKYLAQYSTLKPK